MPLSEAEISDESGVVSISGSGDSRITDEGSLLYVAHKEGDITAFAKLEMLHGENALNLATKMLQGDRYLAEDMVQEAWLKALRTESFDPRKPFRSYFLTIVANVCRDYFRCIKNKPIPQSLDERPYDGAKLADMIVAPSERFFSADCTSELVEIARGIRGHGREVLSDTADGLSFEEIAQVSGRSKDTERWHVSEMRRKAKRIASERGIHLRGAVFYSSGDVHRSRACVTRPKSVAVKTQKPKCPNMPRVNPEQHAALSAQAQELTEPYCKVFSAYLNGVPYTEMRELFSMTQAQIDKAIIQARRQCAALLHLGHGI